MARFIISHRLAGKVSASAQDASRAAVEKAAGGMRAFASVAGKVEPKGEATRKTLVVDCDPRDMEATRADFDADVMVEPEAPRLPAALFLRSVATAAAEAPTAASAAGIGAMLNLTLNSQSAPVAGAQATVLFGGLFTGASTSVVTESDAKGKLSVAYDPRQWYPKTAIIVPKDGYWSWWQNNPYDQLVLELPALPKSGPVGWWHQIMGVKDYSETRGRGIRVGVADTGVGPHPYLAHVQSIGAFINGNYNKAAAAGADIEDHGTHVSGIIGARPPSSSGDFAGLAPGADVFVARVFPNKEEAAGGPSSANQGDIASAIDALSSNHQADLINLSLGGSQASEIEQDAVAAALERGTVVICASGNAGGPVMYPAAYPHSIAVGALGLVGMVPVGSLAAAGTPSAADHFAAGGLYVASFSNTGPQLTCAGPGVGIISTVPAQNKGDGAPYADMSGTSMASPAVCGRLAGLLSDIEAYRNLPRDTSRAQLALTALAQVLYPLGLSPLYAGGGLPTLSC